MLTRDNYRDKADLEIAKQLIDEPEIFEETDSFRGHWSNAVNLFWNSTLPGAGAQVGRLKNADSPLITPDNYGEEVEIEEATKEVYDNIKVEGYKLDELGMKYEEGHTKEYWNVRADIAVSRKRRENIIMAADLNPVIGFMSGMVPQALDPSSYIPFGAPIAKWGPIAARPMLRKLLVPMAEGAVGNLAVDVAVLKPALKKQGLDMSWDEISMDTYLGAGVGLIFGTGRVMYGKYAELDKAQRASKLMTAKAVADIAAGRPVDVANIAAKGLEDIDEATLRQDMVDEAEATPEIKELRRQIDELTKEADRLRKEKPSLIQTAQKNRQLEIDKTLSDEELLEQETTRREFIYTAQKKRQAIIDKTFSDAQAFEQAEYIHNVRQNVTDADLKHKGIDAHFVVDTIIGLDVTDLTKGRLRFGLGDAGPEKVFEISKKLPDITDSYIEGSFDDFYKQVVGVAKTLYAGLGKIEAGAVASKQDLSPRAYLNFIKTGGGGVEARDFFYTVNRVMMAMSENFQKKGITPKNVERFTQTYNEAKARFQPKYFASPRYEDAVFGSTKMYSEGPSKGFDESMENLNKGGEAPKTEAGAGTTATPTPKEYVKPKPFYPDKPPIVEDDRFYVFGSATEGATVLPPAGSEKIPVSVKVRNALNGGNVAMKKTFDTLTSDERFIDLPDEIKQITVNVGRSIEEASKREMILVDRVIETFKMMYAGFRVPEWPDVIKPKDFGDIRKVLIKELVSNTSHYTADEVDSMVKTIQRRLANDKYMKLETLRDFMLKSISEDASTKYWSQANQILKVESVWNRLQRFPGAHEARTIMEAFAALLGGSHRPVKGASYSIDAVGKVTAARRISDFIKDLEDAGILKLVTKNKDKTFERNIARELSGIDENGKATNVTKNKDAATAAEIIHKHREIGRTALNAEGANIGRLIGYITAHGHDRKKMRAKLTGFAIEKRTADYQKALNAWRNEIKPRLDYDKTFSNKAIEDEEVDKILEEIFLNIVTGKSVRKVGDISDTGDYGLAELVSQHRELHFKTADDWFDYNQKYGKSSLTRSLMNDITHSAQQWALMRNLGTNPDATIKILQKKINKAAGQDPLLKKDQDYYSRRVENMYHIMSGAANIVENELMSTVGSNVSMLTDTALLGASQTAAYVSDSASFIANAHYLGVPILKATKTYFLDGFMKASFWKNADSETRHMLARSFGIGIDSIIGEFRNRYTLQEEGGSRFIAWLHRFFFQVNGLQQITDTSKISFTNIMSNLFTDAKKLSWKELDTSKNFSGLKSTLSKYDIGETEWNKIMSAEPTKGPDGNLYLLPENLPEDVALKYATFMFDQADTAVITPGVKERAILTQGFQPGTLPGEVLRQTTKFKSFALTLYTKFFQGMLERNALDSRGWGGFGKEVLDNVAPLLASATYMTFCGVLLNSISDILKGKEPKILGANNGKRIGNILWAGVVRGGAGGIFGDVLNSYSRPAQMLGPVPGRLYDAGLVAGSAWSSVVHGEKFDTSRAAWLAKSSLPFSNFPIISPILENIIVGGINETVNPGYTRNMERKYKKKYGTGFLFH
jgi:hypothetical protein